MTSDYSSYRPGGSGGGSDFSSYFDMGGASSSYGGTGGGSSGYGASPPDGT